MKMNLRTFFKEKEIPYTEWKIEHNGINHFIDSEVVVEAILTTKGTERKRIELTLSILDFKNTSILDYLKALAESLIRKQFSIKI